MIRPNWGNMNYDDIAEPGEDADGGTRVEMKKDEDEDYEEDEAEEG